MEKPENGLSRRPCRAHHRCCNRKGRATALVFAAARAAVVGDVLRRAMPGDQIAGFTMIGSEAGEVMAMVKAAMPRAPAL